VGKKKVKKVKPKGKNKTKKGK